MSIKRHQAGKLLSAAVEYNGVVYVAGQVAEDLSQAVKGQTEQVLKKIDALLAAAGTSKSKNPLSQRVGHGHSQSRRNERRLDSVGRSCQPAGTRHGRSEACRPARAR